MIDIKRLKIGQKVNYTGDQYEWKYIVKNIRFFDKFVDLEFVGFSGDAKDNIYIVGNYYSYSFEYLSSKSFAWHTTPIDAAKIYRDILSQP